MCRMRATSGMEYVDKIGMKKSSRRSVVGRGAEEFRRGLKIVPTHFPRSYQGWVIFGVVSDKTPPNGPTPGQGILASINCNSQNDTEPSSTRAGSSFSSDRGLGLSSR